MDCTAAASAQADFFTDLEDTLLTAAFALVAVFSLCVADQCWVFTEPQSDCEVEFWTTELLFFRAAASPTAASRSASLSVAVWPQISSKASPASAKLSYTPFNFPDNLTHASTLGSERLIISDRTFLSSAELRGG